MKLCCCSRRVYGPQKIEGFDGVDKIRRFGWPWICARCLTEGIDSKKLSRYDALVEFKRWLHENSPETLEETF